MVETRLGGRKKKEEISNPVVEASKAVEEASASNPVAEEVGEERNPALEEDDEERNPALEEDGEEKEASITPEVVSKDREECDTGIAAVLASIRAEDDVREPVEEVASVGEGVRADRVAPEESAEDSVSLTSKTTEEGEDGGDGSGSKNVEASNREEEEEEEQEEEQEEEHEEEHEGDEEDEEDGSEHREHLEPNDPDEFPAMGPLMYFPPSEYPKKMKISTRCRIYETVEYLKEGLEQKLTKRELDWFEKHPQFKHIFHMKRDQTHKVMAMWMLLLRTARIDKKKEVWFVVNGVPIRYSLREHALISGLDCRLYPLHYKEAGSDRFKNKYFKGKKKITIEDVKKELDVMVPDNTDNRLRMAVLYFLCTVMVGQTKNSGKQASGVDPFCLRAVDNLIFCRNFPWGRYSFEYMLSSVSHTMSHFGGLVWGKSHPVPGFCIPLELLPFEAIPQLGNEFLEATPNADERCPRMCRRQFKAISMTGWPLEKIYKTLDTTTEITSILTAVGEEIPLLEGLMEEGEEDDTHDPVVATWMRRLERGLPVYFEELYQQDVDSRVEQHHEAVEEDDEQPRVDTIELVDLMKDLKEDVKKQMENMKEEMQTQMDAVKEEMQTQVETLEKQVHDLQKQLDNRREMAKDPPTEIASSSHDAEGSKKKRKKGGGKTTKSRKSQKKNQD